MTLALAPDPKFLSPDLFSVVTISDARTDTPAWHRRLRWPSVGDSHVALDLRRSGRQNVWAAQIDDAILHTDRKVLLVADGIGCFATSWWARLSPTHYVSRVAGALLLDPDRDAEEAERRAQFASPSIALPFPSVVLTADGANAGADSELDALVSSWGSRAIAGGRQRSADPRAWHSAQRLIGRIAGAVVARDIERGLALRGEGR